MFVTVTPVPVAPVTVIPAPVVPVTVVSGSHSRVRSRSRYHVRTYNVYLFTFIPVLVPVSVPVPDPVPSFHRFAIPPFPSLVKPFIFIDQHFVEKFYHTESRQYSHVLIIDLHGLLRTSNR